MNILGTQIMQAIDRSLTPAPARDPGAVTIAAVVGKRSVCTPADKAKILELDKQYSEAYRVACTSGYPDAKRAHALEIVRQSEKLATGQFDSADFWSQQDFVEDFQQRQAAAKHSMLLIGVAGATISKPICAVVSRILHEHADEAEANDKAQCARFAIDYTGSPVAARLRQLAASVLARVASGGGSRPKHYCPFLFES